MKSRSREGGCVSNSGGKEKFLKKGRGVKESGGQKMVSTGWTTS